MQELPLLPAERLRGVMLGTAVGDSLGLPAEGISRRRSRRLFPRPWRHRFLLKRGMLSDDTEHAFFVGQALLAYPDSAQGFGRRLARSLRWWLLALPAGVGWATVRAIARLWIGIGPLKSGVRSAGNGAVMRAAPLGAFFAGSPRRLDEYLKVCTGITHSDPRALTGATAVARIAAWVMREGARKSLSIGKLSSLLLSAAGEDEEWAGLVKALCGALRRGSSVCEFADSLGLEKGVTGYVSHTVPVAIYAWRRHYGDFEATLGAVLDCGGDSDSVGAIAGALAGAVVGEAGIPAGWIDGIIDWPRGVGTLRRLADGLAVAREGTGSRNTVRYPVAGVVVRNAVFLAVVLLHGLRRLAPPY